MKTQFIQAHFSTVWKVLAALLILPFFAGCAPPPEKRKRFFWPMISQHPKVEFIDYYISDYDVEEGKESFLTEAIMGRRQPTPLFSRPSNVAADGARSIVYVIDSGRHLIWVLDMQKHEVRTLLSQKKQTQRISMPTGLAVGPEGGLYVSDANAKKIFRFDDKGVLRAEISSEQFERPVGMAYDGARDRLYVVDAGRHHLLQFDGGGTLEKTIGKRGSRGGEFNFPTDVDVAPDGRIVVLDSLNARVQVFDSEGNFVRAFGERGTAGGSFALAKGVAVDSDNHVYVTDALADKVVIFNLEGQYLMTIGGRHINAEKGGVSPGGFYLPQGIDVDKRGGIWICDTFNKAVYKFQYLNERYLQENPIRAEDIYADPDKSGN